MSEAGAPPPALLDGAVCAVHGTAATFVCARCGNYGCEGCVGTIVEEARLCASCAARGVERSLPWERYREEGLFSAFWQTTARVTFSPTETFRDAPEGGGLFAPVVYGILAWSLAPAVGLVLYWALFAAFFGLSGDAAPGPLGGEEAVGLLALACLSVGFGLIMVPVYATFATILDAGVAHLVLYLTGPVRRPFDATLRAVSYANAPYVLLFVPCFGILVAPLWTMVVEIIALREVQGVSNGRASLAVLGHRVLIVGAIVFFYALLIGAVIATMPAPR